MIDEATRGRILVFQRNEITEHNIYSKLAAACKDKNNSQILAKIAGDELRHYGFWKTHTNKDVGPDNLTFLRYYLVSRIFGLTFGIKLMERGEVGAQGAYDEIAKAIPEAVEIRDEENEHEKKLIEMIDEERLRYVGSIVLGLNDALVELTGALAGFTLALANSKLIAVTGGILGVAASLSMAASEYLSAKTEGGRDHRKSAVYTGVAYVLTVLLLVAPYVFISNIYAALGLTLLTAVVIIAAFTFYISVAKDTEFRKSFLEMAGISLGVAAVTFAIAYLVRTVLGIEV
jgi:VIT1/CCC1 family predicted Fe2+/Mn2+ transporter